MPSSSKPPEPRKDLCGAARPPPEIRHVSRRPSRTSAALLVRPSTPGTRLGPAPCRRTPGSADIRNGFPAEDTRSAVTVLARTLVGHLRRLPWMGGLLATSPRPDHQRRRHRFPGLHALAALARDAGFDVVVAAPHEDASGVSASVKAVRAARRGRAAAPAGDPRAAGRRGVRGGGAPGVHRARVGSGLAGPGAGHRAVGRELRRERRPGGAALRHRRAPRSPRACTGGGALAVLARLGVGDPRAAALGRRRARAAAGAGPAAGRGRGHRAVGQRARPARRGARPAARGHGCRSSAWRRSPCGTTTRSTPPCCAPPRGPGQPSRTPSPTSRCSPRGTPR